MLLASAYIGIGSNLGERRDSILTAVEMLRALPGVESVEVSSIQETEPVGGPEGQGRYLNAAARIATRLSPTEVLGLLRRIEGELGRVRRERWGARTIDLDLLLYDDRVIDTPELTVPHPRMHERRFVLEPLAEIAGNAVHPVMGRTIQDLLASLL